jgi:pimeloyl-ACP methyl ester carboxylesterase
MYTEEVREEKSAITYKGSRLHYETIGNGPQVYLAFHGFAQNSSYFALMVAPLAQTHTFYCFDLFFHKQSHWDHGLEPLEKAHWAELMTAFLAQENIDRFNLTAFSLGGRFALVTYELFAERIDTLSLISPDGIKTNIWYRLGSSPTMRPIFTSMLAKPEPFLAFNQRAKKIMVVPSSVADFNHSQLSVRHRRKRVVLTWIVFRPMQPKLSLIANLAQKHGTKFRFLLGQYDPIINWQTVQPLVKKLASPRIFLLPTGHYKLMEKVDSITLKQFFNRH